MSMSEEEYRELLELRDMLKQHPQMYKQFYENQAVAAFQRTIMLGQIPKGQLATLAKSSKRVEYPRGSLIVREGVFEEENVIVIADGEIQRWAQIDGRKHAVDTFDKNSIGSLHLYHRYAARFNAECLTPVVAYHVPRTSIDTLLEQNPGAAKMVISSLSQFIRNNCFVVSTPFLDQRQDPGLSITATSIGAGLDAFYRSAMNNLINERLTGVRGRFFPNMTLQVPARILYINGLKQVRTAAQEYMNPNDPAWKRACITFIPGVAMTPVASVLEAVNAQQNPEPLHTRCVRGVVPRVGREILFALGINQLSDYCTERFSWIGNTHLRGATGSISAGVVAGFLSHIPHNLSTLKLQHPNVSYAAHWERLYSRYLDYVPPTVRDVARRRMIAQAMCIFFPIGVVRRSFQIGGTFIIINGSIFAFRDHDWI